MNTFESDRKYELLLACVIAARGTSLLFSKILLQSFGSFNLLAIRFLLAFFLLVLFFGKHLLHIKRNSFLAGVRIGTLFFLTMSSELTALKQADSSMVALLENCAIIIVPVLELILLKRLMQKQEIISALLALLGVFCITMSRGSFSGSAAFALLAALIYAFTIIVTGKLSHELDDPLAIGIVQVGTIGTLACIVSLLQKDFHLPQTGQHWLFLAVLAIVCTGFGSTLQPVAQSRVSVERAGLFCAISPAVANVLGIAVLHEPVTLLGVLGLFLILISIIFPYLRKG